MEDIIKVTLVMMTKSFILPNFLKLLKRISIYTKFYFYDFCQTPVPSPDFSLGLGVDFVLPLSQQEQEQEQEEQQEPHQNIPEGNILEVLNLAKSHTKRNQTHATPLH